MIVDRSRRRNLTHSNYKSEIHPLSPVAIKLGQHEVHAPGHDTWGEETCDICGEKFTVGPNRIYGSRLSEQGAVTQLKAILAKDHELNRPHVNSYEIPD